MDYTYCRAQAPSTLTDVPSSQYPLLRWSFDAGICTLEFEINERMDSPVFMYYGLTNFFQNQRRYVKSLDIDQLKGNKVTTGSLEQNCNPLRYANDIPNNPYGNFVEVSGVNVTIQSDAQVYPCGMIANSMFSDDIGFELGCVPGSGCSSNYQMTDEGIALSTERDVYKPTLWNETLQGSALTTFLVPPPMWRTAWPDIYGGGYTNENLPNLQTWERLQVWMRNAALPSFRKLWARNNDVELLPGRYTLAIADHYDTSLYSGTKSIVFTTISVLGGHNPFLGIAYMAVGGACWVVGFLFLIRHVIRPRKLGDYSYLSWNQQPSGPASAASDAAGMLTDGLH